MDPRKTLRFISACTVWTAVASCGAAMRSTMVGAIALVLGLLCLPTGAGSAPAATALRIAVISDINGRYGTTSYHQRVPVALERLIALKPDLVLSTGDMVAGQRPSPMLNQAEIDAMWQSFDRNVRAPLQQAGIPLLMTPGNHDASAYPGFKRERDTYSRVQAAHPPDLPPLPGGEYPFHYAVVVDNVLLISLDATASGPLPPRQLTWLQQQLATAGDYQAVVMFGHLPLQPITRGRERDVITDAALESLLTATGKAIYLSGHHHAYYPGRRLGIDMLSIGNLGGNQRRLVGTDITTGFSFTLLTFDQQGSLGITAYRGPDFTQPFDITRLPATLGSGSRGLQRLDLAAPAQLH